jgi:PAS domain S-box-containing protein
VQLVDELKQLRQRVAELEARETAYRLTEAGRDRLLTAEREQRAQIEALHWAAAVLSSTLNYEKVLDHILEQINRVVSCQAACIMLLEGKMVRIFRSHGYTQMEAVGVLTLAPFNIADVPTLRTIRETGWPLASSFVMDYDAWVATSGQGWIKSYLTVPIRTRVRLIGFLHADSDTPGFYSQADAEHLQAFANEAAIALENARLYDRARQEIVKRVKAVKKERNLLRTLIDNLPDYIYVKDRESRFTVGNRAVAHVMGARAPEELVGKTDFDFYPEELAAQYYADEQMVIQSGQSVFNREEPIVDPTGNPGWISTAQVPLQDEKGRIVGLVGIGRDITERKRAAAEREKLIEELDAFAHTVAHDLQNPLAQILGRADYLQEHSASMTNEELPEHLQAIVRTGRKMSNVITELLLLSGVRKRQVELSPLDMASIVAEARERLADMIEESQAELILPPGWPIARGYAPWIEEVWINYLSNALKYGGQPPRVELGGIMQADSMVRFWIRDNGPGLTIEEQARLFTPFTQLGQAQTKGQGLGLSIVRRIMEKLGGQVGVESEGVAGQGSTFFFTLPGLVDPSLK